MASNMFSKFLNSGNGESIYETLQQNDTSSDPSDVEERAGLALDEENLGREFHDFDLDLANADASPKSVFKSIHSTRMGEERPVQTPQVSAGAQQPQRQVLLRTWMKMYPNHYFSRVADLKRHVLTGTCSQKSSHLPQLRPRLENTLGG